MDDGSPALEVGFTIDTSNAFDDLAQLQQAMNSTEAKIVAEAKSIEKATGSMLDLSGATASVKTFGTAATRESRSAAIELQKVERAGESLSRQLEKQATTFGKTREEIRAMKVEAAALKAEQQGLGELAARLRTQEMELFAAELAASRQARFEAEAAAEAKQQAAQAAIIAAEQEAAVVKRAADAYRVFEAVAKQKSAAYRQSQIDAAAEAREVENLAAAGVRLRASIDPVFAAQNRFNVEMGNAKKLISAGVIGLDDYAAKLRLERQLLEEATDAHGNAGAAARGNGSALAAIAPQAQDAFTQISMGTNVLNVFAIQAGQAASQMVYMEGAAGKFGKFMLGPWGLALTGGTLVLGALVGKMLEHNDALNDAVDKLKKDAADTEINRQAKDRFRLTMEGVTAAVRESTEATQKEIEAQRTSAEQANISAKNRLEEALAVRAAAQARLEGVRADLQAQITAAQAPSQRGEVAALGISRFQSQIAEINKQLVDSAAQIAALQARVQGTRILLAEEAAKRATDPIERIKKQYDDQVAAAKDAARAQIAAGGTVTSALTLQLAQIERNRQAALKAEQDRQSAMKETAQVGRDIDIAEARRIAQSIGARITSEQRSYAEQKALYDKYMAYKAGKGPWAALAAAPGSSAHETGSALDIAKTPGMSMGKIREAFRAAGVSIKELLDEGDHFHIAWKKGADTAAAASKKLADAQADLAKKFDPAAAAAIEYQAVLKSIADAKLDPDTAARYGEAAAEAFRKARAAAFQLPSMAEISVQADADRAAEKSAEEFGRNILQPLRDELALYGLVGPARARAALELEKEGFLAKNIADGADVAAARWQEYYALKSQLIEKDSALEAQAEAARRLQEDLAMTADGWDTIARSAQNAGRGMADAFGEVGQAIGDMATIYAGYQADSARADAQHIARLQALKEASADEGRIARENARFKIEASSLQIGAYGDMAAAAKGFFGENTAGYQALATAEKAFRAVEFALSVRAMAQDASETVGAIARSGARAAAHGVEAVAKAIASLPFPLNLAAGAATAAAIASLGIAIGGSFGGGGQPAPSNTGTGTVLGDASAKSDSVKRAIDELKAVDTLTNVYSRQMLESLRSIDSQIGGVASVIVRGGDINASANVNQGFKPNLIGSVLGSVPLIGGILGGLFGTRTDVTGSGIYGGAQSLESILGGGFNGQAYSDITKTKKFLGIVSGRSSSTQYGALDPSLSNQFTLILRSFNDSIAAAVGPLGESTEEIQKRLNGFVVNIGKIDLKGLTGEQIQEKLTAVFGAAADGMANAALPGLEQFQKVGEGAFETLVRVASTAEQVTTSLDLLGTSTRNLGLSAKLGLADQFDSLSALKDAAEGYFQAFYSQEEQAAAKTAQMAKVFASLGFAVPGTLASFRQLVEAQDLTTAAGQAAYATLLQLAPAFADLQQSMAGAKSAADVLSERQDLERQILELQGRTDELRRLDLAKLDASNRALQQQVWALQDSAAATQAATQAAEEAAQAQKAIAQERAGLEQQLLQLQGDTATLRARQLEGLDASNRALQQQIYAVQDAQEAAKAAADLRQAWTSIGDTIEDEVKRIRGLTGPAAGSGFASLLGQFNAATIAARGGSQDAAKSLPQLSQALLAAAADAATSQQELARVQAQTARSLEDTLSLIGGGTGSSSDVLARAAVQVAATAPAASDSGGLMEELRLLRQEVADMRQDNNRGHAATAGNTGATKRMLENVTNQSGGDAISIIAAEPLPTVAAA